MGSNPTLSAGRKCFGKHTWSSSNPVPKYKGNQATERLCGSIPHPVSSQDRIDMFHRHEWVIKKTVKMYWNGPDQAGPFTRVWYMCDMCEKTKVMDRHNHLTLNEIQELFPRP